MTRGRIVATITVALLFVGSLTPIAVGADMDGVMMKDGKMMMMKNGQMMMKDGKMMDSGKAMEKK